MKKIIILPISFFILLGFFGQGNGDVLCIGEDGHIEIETTCLPCCTEEVEKCNIPKSSEEHAEHDDCNNCSDLVLDNPIWSKRFFKNTISDQTKHVSVTASKTIKNTYFSNIILSKSYLSELEFKEFPNSSFVSITVLRC